MIISDITKKILWLKFKIISSLGLALCIDQFNLFQFLPLQPNISFLTLFFWWFFFGHQLSLLLIFMFGLMFDLLGGSVMGENTLSFIILFGSLSFYKEYYGLNRELEWGVLWISIAALIILQIFILSLIYQRIIFSWGHLGNNLINVLFYPVLKSLLMHWTKEND